MKRISTIQKAFVLTVLACSITLVPALADSLSVPSVTAEASQTLDTAAITTRTMDDLVRIGSNASLKKGETCKDLVVVNGTAKVDGHVTGDMVVVVGTAEVNGIIDGDLVLVGSDASFAPSSQVKGSMVTVFGKALVPDGAFIGQDKVQIAPPIGDIFNKIKTYAKYCLFKGRFVAVELPWTLVVLGVLMLFGFFLSAIFHQTFAKAAQLSYEKPMQVFLAGLLTVAAAGPVAITLIGTVIGIPLAPIFILLLKCLMLIGATAFCASIGRRISMIISPSAIPAAAAVAIGAVLVFGLAVTPYIGGAVLIFTATFGAGAGVYGFYERIRGNGNKNGTPGQNQPQSGAPVTAPATTVVSSSSAVSIDPQTATAPAAVLSSPSTPIVESETPATMWHRLAAAFIDIILVFLVFGLTIGLLIGPGKAIPIPQDGPAKAVLLLIYLIAMWSWKGTTIGNIVFHLQVRRMDDSKVTFGVAFIRGLSMILSVIPLGVGFFWIQWDPLHQAWHDKIAGTKVVKVPKGISLL
jgi:uncharacterized RDD family membrane protein YckC